MHAMVGREVADVQRMGACHMSAMATARPGWARVEVLWSWIGDKEGLHGHVMLLWFHIGQRDRWEVVE